MADNVGYTPGAGASIAADDISGVLYQRMKVTLGADGVNGGDLSSSNPMPVTSGISLPAWDYMSLSSGATTDTYTFKTGGAGGSTVATVALEYTDATKATLSTVTKS